VIAQVTGEVNRAVGQDFVACCGCEPSLVRYIAVVATGIVGAACRKRRAVEHVVIGERYRSYPIKLIGKRTSTEQVVEQVKLIVVTVVFCGHKNPFKERIGEIKKAWVKGELSAGELAILEGISGGVESRIEVVTYAGGHRPSGEPALG